MTDNIEDISARLAAKIAERAQPAPEPERPPAMPLPDGIYLNLRNEAYHADPALGGGDHVDLLDDPVQWHAENRNADWRALNPPSERVSTGKAFGSALHCALLEPAAFNERYYVEPTPPDLPKTKDEIIEAIRKAGYSSGLTRSDLLEKWEYDADLFGVTTMKAWKSQMAANAAGRLKISAQWDRELRLIQHMVERHPSAGRFLSNGYSEVSLFWTVEGLRLKCRFDYLRSRTCADLKSYARREGDETIQSFVRSAENYGYLISAAHYMDGRVNALPQLVEEGRIFDASVNTDRPDIADAEPIAFEFFDRVADWKEPTWWWIACMTQGFPEVDAIELPLNLLGFAAAQSQVEQARATYREFAARFGAADAWVPTRDLVRLTDYNFSSWSANRGARRWEVGAG